MTVAHIVTDDADLDRQLRAVTEALNEFSEGILADPVLVEDLAFASGTEQTVFHGMNRIARGWLIVKKNAAVDIHESSTADDLRSSINLTASAAATVSLLFF